MKHKTSFVVGALLLLLFALSFRVRTGDLPWSVTPPSDPNARVSDTVEFHTYTVRTLTAGQCTNLSISVANTAGAIPDEFQVFVQCGDNRYTANIASNLRVGSNDITVNLSRLWLIDKATMDVFNPDAGAVSDMGAHV